MQVAVDADRRAGVGPDGLDAAGDHVARLVGHLVVVDELVAQGPAARRSTARHRSWPGAVEAGDRVAEVVQPVEQARRIRLA
ncbi:MAG: hypothetical protein U0P45_04300 [Acidimicrobiales bacterium]